MKKNKQTLTRRFVEKQKVVFAMLVAFGAVSGLSSYAHAFEVSVVQQQTVNKTISGVK